MKPKPHRTCVGCRRIRPRAELLRLVLAPGGVVRIDRSGSAPGRGAYICPLARCAEETLKRGRLARAFRGKAQASADLEGFSREEFAKSSGG